MVDQPSRWRTARIRAVIALSSAAIIGGGLALSQGTASAAPPPSPDPSTTAGKTKQKTLDKHDLELLTQAQRAGERTVTMLVAAERGQSSKVADAVADLGGSVRKSEKKIDYLRVTVPTNKAKAVAALPSAASVDLNENLQIDDPRPGPNGDGTDGQADPTPQPAPDKKTPLNNPYMPTRDIQSAQFVQAHKTWDGRGVTIGIIDSGVALDHPSLATTSTGERKIVDSVTFSDPANDDDPTWVPMSTQTFNAGQFTFGGRTWTAPAGGPYRAGVFAPETDASFQGSEFAGDLNRDGDTNDTFGVLQDTTNKRVRVDVDQDGNFGNNPSMIDYKVAFESGFFGTDDPSTAIAERVPFVVQTNVADFVNIGIVSSEHGSHVAGIAAGNSLFGGKMSGAAPGAKIKAVRACLFGPGCSSFALVEGMIYLAQSGVDVINMSIGGLPALNNGDNARAVLYNRLINDFNVQMFISAGNEGAGENTVGDPSVATDVVSVGSYITDATWRSNYGSNSTFTENLHGFSSRGPREDGGMKPTVIAPGAAVSTTPLWEEPGPVPGTYTLPPGYAMLNGTSMSSPQTTGAAALLVSAFKARHAGQRPTPPQLRTAISSTTRFVSRFGAYEQGAGLVQTLNAWALLDRVPNADTVTTRVPVSTALSQFLPTPNVGTGIHDREGVTAGTTYTRTYTLTRTTGAAGNRFYVVYFLGNDGTFSAPGSVRLPLNTAVQLPVTVRVGSAGVHSALMRIDDTSTRGIDVQTVNTVIAPEEFTTANGFTISKSGTIGRNQTRSFFVRVPEGAPTMRVDMNAGGAPGKGQVRFLRFHPYGVGLEDNSSLSCYNPEVVPDGSCAGSPTSRTVSNPLPGVWEVEVEARRTSDVTNAPYQLSVKILGASVSPNPDVIPSATIGTPIARQYTLTSLFGEFTGRAVGSPLGSAKRARPTIADLAQQQNPVTVPAGATTLSATIGNTSDPGADLDLFVFDCTTGTCVLAGQSADGDSEESVTIENPAAGLWVVLVDGFAVPAGTTEYDYTDVYVTPNLGSVQITDSNASRPTGATWTVNGTVTAQGQPGAGRVLLGHVNVVTDDGVVVGTGDVIVQSVT